MTSIQPELWLDSPRDAVAFYEAAFGATVLHQVGDGDDIVAQLGVGEAAFWVAGTSVARPAAHCSSSKTRTAWSGRQSTPVRRRRRPSRTSTAGGSAASSIPSATSGRSARRSGRGRCRGEPRLARSLRDRAHPGRQAQPPVNGPWRPAPRGRGLRRICRPGRRGRTATPARRLPPRSRAPAHRRKDRDRSMFLRACLGQLQRATSEGVREVRRAPGDACRRPGDGR
jgi:hypothetical protein